MAVVAEALVQAVVEMQAHRLDVVEQVVAHDHLLHGECRRAGHRMAEIGMAVLEKAAAVFEGVEDLLAQQSRADRQLGRASCRARGCKYVSISLVGVSLKKKKI